MKKGNIVEARDMMAKSFRKTLVNPWFCPTCGKRLIGKEGQYGQFMACPGYPGCRYTRAMWTYLKVKPFCDKCKGTGKIPFIKDGKIIPYCQVYCECHQEEPEHFYPVTPDDFDFSLSYSYHRSLCQQHGWQDPGSDKLPGEIAKRPYVPRPIYNITYQVKDIDVSPAFKELQEKTQHLKEKIAKYFESNKRENAPF